MGGGVGVGAGTVPLGLVKQAINAGPGQAAAENARRAYTPYPKKIKEKALAGRGSAGELPEREGWQLFFCVGVFIIPIVAVHFLHKFYIFSVWCIKILRI